jgi:hypothetical protein
MHDRRMARVRHLSHIDILSHFVSCPAEERSMFQGDSQAMAPSADLPAAGAVAKILSVPPFNYAKSGKVSQAFRRVS